MQTSIFLAKVIGLFSVISSLAVLVRYKRSIEIEEEGMKNPALSYVVGFGILIIGVLLVVAHPVWVKDWPVAITIIGWLVLLKGLGRIFFPDSIKTLIGKKKNNRWFMLGEIVLLIVGICLLYHGFMP